MSDNPTYGIDHIYVLTAPGYEKTRLPLAVSELVRVGLVESTDDPRLTVHYGTHPRLFDFVLDNTERLGPAMVPGCYSQNVVTAFNYYMILNEARERNFKRIIYVEDDIRFLKDAGHVKEVLSSIPQEADLAMLEWIACDLDYFRSGKHKEHLAKHKGNLWIPMHPYATFAHAGAQILSEKARDTMILLIESGWYEIKGKRWCNAFKVIDQWQDQGVLGQFDIKSFFSCPLVCIQDQSYGGYGGTSLVDYNRSCAEGLDLSKFESSKSIIDRMRKRNDSARRHKPSKPYLA